MADLPTFRLITGDCLEAMAQMPEASVDAIVTDPPYGLGFMGRAWDDLPPGDEFGKMALRVLKPGGHLLAFGGTRTYHRLACAIEDAGFEIRDCLAWMYGSGFPKSLDVSKAIDKAAGVEREVVGQRMVTNLPRDPEAGAGEYVSGTGRYVAGLKDVTAPATPEAQRWQGWGTALKPSYEPIVLARKPLVGTVAGNVLEHGTGALNVDGCRIGTDVETWPKSRSYPFGGDVTYGSADAPTEATQAAPAGRWPANVLLDEQAAAMLDEQTGERPAGGHPNKRGADGERTAYGSFAGGVNQAVGVQNNTTGGASRFFYTAKASSAERNRGTAEYGQREAGEVHRYGAGVGEGLTPEAPVIERNTHPTVKPVDLMQWLCRLITPPGGIVLDPFTGSGSTGIAALREGFDFIGIEREPEYVEIARSRIVGDAPLFNVEADGG